MPVTHDLKCLPAYYDAIKRGEKPFEVRRDDQGYQKGDFLRLNRWSIQRGYQEAHYWSGSYSKDAALPILAEVTFILTGGQFGIEPGYIVMGIRVVEDAG